jgi:hypothetical protein
MNLLLDENLPHALRSVIVGHEVTTVAFLGWSGLDNGRLLAAAAEKGFDALVTNDRGFEYDQHHLTLRLAVVVLLASANTLEAIQPLLPNLRSALENLPPRGFVRVSAS